MARHFRRRKFCRFTADGTEIDYKDVALLRKFISDRGKIRSRRITGVTVQEQREISKAIKNAREMALLPYANRVTQQRGGRDRGGERGIRADGPPPRPSRVAWQPSRVPPARCRKCRC